ncbi:MAG: quinoprotein dehydrogenase-associated SoxYZ-like carrier, partial [Pseudomonas sp.]|nr:quinoprotein dehydrogenase-associated SoxYZ-like carrier [Pseudomonas sp.]
MDWRSLVLLALFAWAWEARAAAPDPVTSVMWDYYHQRLLNGEAFVFDDKVRLEVPPFAEDARQVPIQIDASAYRGKVKRILAWAELNPIPRILDFAPGEHLEPSLAIRIR